MIWIHASLASDYHLERVIEFQRDEDRQYVTEDLLEDTVLQRVHGLEHKGIEHADHQPVKGDQHHGRDDQFGFTGESIAYAGFPGAKVSLPRCRSISLSICLRSSATRRA